MDGMHYFPAPDKPSRVDDAETVRQPLCLTAISIVLMVGGVIALDLVGVSIPFVDEFPSSTTGP